MKIHVNIADDRTDGYSYHPWSPPGIPLPVAALPTHEGETEMLTDQRVNKLTSDVRHAGSTIVLDGHDCGRFIRDISAIPLNGQYPMIWPFSSRKIAFSASTVMMNGTATGCADISGSPPIIMTTCGIITSPIGLPRTNGENTVLVGMTDMDLLAGVLGIILTILTDIMALLISLIEPAFKSDRLKAIFAILDKLFVGSFSGLFKWVVGILIGNVPAVTRWDGKKPLEITIPGPTAEYPSYVYTFDPATGKWTGRYVPSTAPTPSPAPSPSAPQSFAPDGASSPANQDLGHSLEPPDDRSGWAYHPDNGWVNQ